ncbi:MAG: hypothetical protein OEV49_05865 [candidate division Zixibacteria bacterium]|nr:hypothetical protein [candidate division Zixibacteria bacterium]MDH3938617.1 hypothetical protein [candidate division Zixibacteria bacterium]MDH4035370.1 hypothetical protein [candidate division Zixibacteria bacterium]
MKKLIVSTIALSTLLWIGCGDDDEVIPGDNSITVTPGTTVAPAWPLVYNDAAWDDVTATTISLSTGAALPVGPIKSPLGPDKSLAAPSSVDLQAIKIGDRLYLRFQWADASRSIQRDNWELNNNETFRFTWYEGTRGEDEVFAMFEGAPGGGWDTWNWRLLTTGTQNLAEDLTFRNDSLIADAGANSVAFQNRPKSINDPTQPTYVDSSEWEFTGDVMYSNHMRNLDIWVQANARNWTVGQTVPGWYIVAGVDWENIDESRWDVRTAHHFDEQAGQWTVVMSRTLAGSTDDVSMANISRIKTRIGVLDNYTDIAPGSSQRAFSADFWIALP